jgi:hypothetical protein
MQSPRDANATQGRACVGPPRATQPHAAYFTNAFAQSGPWLGASQAAGSAEPLGGWARVTGEPWAFTAWAAMEPNNDPVTEAYPAVLHEPPRLHARPVWNDVFLNGDVRAYIVELE